MCDKLPYNGRRIDPCLIDTIASINAEGKFTTLLSCCGHGKYSRTIVVLEKSTRDVIEFFSQIFLSHGVRKSRKYYTKDRQGFYYIPEIEKIVGDASV